MAEARTTGEATGTVRDAEQQILDLLAVPEGDDNPEAVQDEAVETETEVEAEADVEEFDADEQEAAEDSGSEDEDEPEAEEQEPEAPVYRIKVDGEEVEVTLDELQKGYSRQADYTRKSQALAEQRKAIEQHEAQLRAEREQVLQYQQQIQQLMTQQEQEPDWDAEYQRDPIGAVQLERQWRAKKEQQQKLAEHQQQLALRQQQEQAEEMQRMISENRKRLPEMIPEWKDEAVANRERTQLRDFLLQDGFSEQEVGSISDARAVRLARDAMLYRQMQAKRKSLKQAPPKSTKTVAPQAARSESEVKQRNLRTERQRLKQTGNVRDAASLIERML